MPETEQSEHAVPGHADQRWKMVLSWALVVAWACVIFIMSSHTGNDLTEGDDLIARVKQWLEAVQMQLFGPDVDLVSSLAHFCEFTIFGALLANAVNRFTGLRRRWLVVFIAAVAVASAYAVTDEIHQIFVPGRMCDVLDWIVDTVGAALGAGIWVLVVRKCAQRGLALADHRE